MDKIIIYNVTQFAFFVSLNNYFMLYQVEEFGPKIKQIIGW